MRKVIVIGGSGFLGQHLLSILQKEEIEVLACENKTPLKTTETTEIVRGGITAVDIQLLNHFNPDVIFHCARPTLPRFRKFGRRLAANKAYKLNKKLIENIEKADNKPKLVFASGSLMYGNSSLSHNELSPINPISYAKQYVKGEVPVNIAITKTGLTVLVLRFPWLLGNGSWFKWFYLENIKKQKAVPTFGDLKNFMEIVDVEDAAKLFKLYAEKITESGFYNITTRNPKSQADFLNEVKNEFETDLVDSAFFFPKPPEKEALEAFTSNIILSTLHPEILDNFQFNSLQETLKRIKAKSKAV